MRVLIGCEESATVREAFAILGHDAWSCDLLPSRVPGKHIQADILTVLNDGWDLAIFHTPCTYLSNSGVRWLYNKDGSRNQKRWELMERDALLFKATMEANIPMKANENPIMHKYAVEIIGRRQDQVIQPSMFGHTQSKATCLWLQNLPQLVATNDVSEIMKTMSKKETQRIHYMPPSPDRQRERSVTFPGIAQAMAQQWGSLAFQHSLHTDAGKRAAQQAFSKPEVLSNQKGLSSLAPAQVTQTVGCFLAWQNSLKIGVSKTLTRYITCSKILLSITNKEIRNDKHKRNPTRRSRKTMQLLRKITQKTLQH